MCEADYDQGSKSVAALYLNCRKERFVRLAQEKLQKIFANFLDAILPELVGDPILKADFLRHLQRMLGSQMTVGFHCQSSSVLMAEPLCNGRNVDSALNTGRCEKMPQVVM